MSADSVSDGATFFGINSGDSSTGAHGTGHTTGGVLNPTGEPTTDLASSTSPSAATGSVGYFPGVGPREDGSDLYRPSSFGAHAPTDTGASGSVATDAHHVH